MKKETPLRLWKTKTFKTEEALDKWVDRHGHKYQVVPVFINNGHGIEIRKKLKIDIK